MQTQIDFVHTRENNRHSEGILEANYERLNNNCKILLDALKRGERLTGFIVVSKYNMMEYRRRFADLRAAGIAVKSEVLKGGFKEYFL